jgi:hypothetical protein
MHTSNSEIQMPQAGRRRGRYSDDFKRQVVTACLEPGVSTAAVALANGLNANLLRRWVVEATQRSGPLLSKTTTLAPVHDHPTFIPVKFDPPAPEVRHPFGEIPVFPPRPANEFKDLPQFSGSKYKMSVVARLAF